MNTLDSAAPFQSPSKLRKQYLAKHSQAAAAELADAVSSAFGVTASPISSASTVSLSSPCPSPMKINNRTADRGRMMLGGNTNSPAKLRMASPAGKGVVVNLLDRMAKLHAPDMLSPQRSASSSSTSSSSTAAAATSSPRAPWSGTNSTVAPASISHSQGSIREVSPLRMRSDASVTSHVPSSGSSNRTVLQPIHQAKLPFQPSPLRSLAPTAQIPSQRSNPNVTRRLFDLPTRPAVTVAACRPVGHAAALRHPPAATTTGQVIDITPSNFLARLQASTSAVTSSARKRKQPADTATSAQAVTLDTFFSSSQSSSSAPQNEECDSMEEIIVKQEFPIVKQEPISEDSPAAKRSKTSEP